MSAKPHPAPTSLVWLENALDAYKPDVHSYELVSKLLMQDLLRHGESCLDRTFFTPGHFTGSAWVVNLARSHVLLFSHKKLNLLLQPGGHADGDPNLLDVAIKELEEESGYTRNHLTLPLGERIFDLDIHHYPAREKNGVLEPEHLHYDVRFLIQIDDKQPIPGSEEQHDFRWVPLAECESVFPKTGGRYRMLSKIRNHAV